MSNQMIAHYLSLLLFITDEESQHNIRTPEALLEAWQNSAKKAEMDQQLQPAGGDVMSNSIVFFFPLFFF